MQNSSDKKRILISAYACEPYKGSEPGSGWSMVVELAKCHEVWVVTRSNNKSVIDHELQKNRISNIYFLYYDLPKCLLRFKKGYLGVCVYYYLWQLCIWKTIKRAHASIRFDLSHHVTFGKYSAPSVLSFLPIPFVWGPVGGGESTPRCFFKHLSMKGRILERSREVARWLSERDPFVRNTARKSIIALAATQETRDRLLKLGCRHVRVVPQCAVSKQQLDFFLNLSMPAPPPLRFLSIGRAVPWKGFSLGLIAFEKAQLPNAEYWLIVNGQDKKRLMKLVRKFQSVENIRFLDPLPSLTSVYRVLEKCHVLVHPALHEAFGNVVLEAMAAGRPILSLDIGGPALQNDENTGFQASSSSFDATIRDLQYAMCAFFRDRNLSLTMGKNAQRRVIDTMTWKTRFIEISDAYAFALKTFYYNIHNENHSDN